MNESEKAIIDIQKEFKKYGNQIKIKTEGQALVPTDPSYDFTNPENNKAPATLSDTIYAFTKEVSPQAQKQLSESIGKNVTGKRVKQFTFYTDTPFNKVDNQITFKDNEYEIVFIDEKEIQDTIFLYKCIGAS